MTDETEIQKLLRLKRYEQPSPEYFRTFLHDFHRRQRAEILRQPAWKIALDRVTAFLSEHSMGRYAYAGATAAVLLFAGIASVEILGGGNSAGPALVADSRPAATAPGAQTALSLNPNIALPNLNASFESGQKTAMMTSPRYVIDARPVSYERPVSF